MFFLWHYSLRVYIRWDFHLWGEMEGSYFPLENKKNKYAAFALLINNPLVQGYCQQQPKTFNRSNLQRRNSFQSSAFTSKNTAPIKTKSTGTWRWRDINEVGILCVEERKSTDLGTTMEVNPIEKINTNFTIDGPDD